MRKPIILISTFGNHLHGLGHVFRDISLAECLKSKAKVIFHINSCSSVMLVPGLKMFDILKNMNMRKAIEKTLPDIVVYDKPYSLGMMEDIGECKNLKIVALDYFYYNDTRIDTAINLKNHYINSRKKIGIGVLREGYHYAIIRDNIIKYRRRSRIGNHAKNIVIIFGGADPCDNTSRIIKVFNSIVGHRYVINIVQGHAFRKISYPIQFSRHKYIFNKNVSEIGKVMFWADLAFCGAGTTMMELLSIGCPTVIIPQTKEELVFARDIVAKNAAVLFGPESDTCSMASIIEELTNDFGRRKRLAKNGMKIFDGFGKKRISGLILQER